MGKFVNTTRSDNINKLIFGLQEIIKNPYYQWINSTPTLVDYYNINIEMSTLDEGAKIEYDRTGDENPIVHNLIKDMYIYGLEKIAVQMENGEYGLESSSIEGEGIILPNTITPYVGDMFYIKYLKEHILFIVDDVTIDTLESGANFYKIRYKLDSTEVTENTLNIKNKYTMILDNVGTKFNPIIRSEKYDLIQNLDTLLLSLKKYYKSLFYSSRVQTLIFKFKEEYFYDPYMIEFITRHDLLGGDDEFIYLSHLIPMPDTFSIDYSRTFFYFLESGKIENLRRYKNEAIGRYINSKTCIFATRPENYFMVDFHYNVSEGRIFSTLPCFPQELLQHIETKSLFENDSPLMIYNPVIKFIFKNGIIITQDEIDNLEFLDYNNNIDLFYGIPALIYCIESYIRDLMIAHKSET